MIFLSGFLLSDARAESSFLAFSNSRRRVAGRLCPARLMKYVSMRMPEPGPLGETLFEARERAMVAALLANSPLLGCVESVLTRATQRFFDVVFDRGIMRRVPAYKNLEAQRV